MKFHPLPLMPLPADPRRIPLLGLALALLSALPVHGDPPPNTGPSGWYTGQERNLGWTMALNVKPWKGRNYIVTGKAGDPARPKEQYSLSGTYAANTNRLALNARKAGSHGDAVDGLFDGSYDPNDNEFHVYSTLRLPTGKIHKLALLDFFCAGKPRKTSEPGFGLKMEPMSKEDSDAMKKSVTGAVQQRGSAHKR